MTLPDSELQRSDAAYGRAIGIDPKFVDEQLADFRCTISCRPVKCSPPTAILLRRRKAALADQVATERQVPTTGREVERI